MKKLLSSLLAVTLLLLPLSAFADFNDVDDTTDYSGAIGWMNENGVIEGYADGNFKPSQCVNRAEFLKMVFITLDISLDDSAEAKLPYTDVSDDDWFAPYVKAAHIRGTVEGYVDRTFRPDQCVNRVEALKISMLEFDIESQNAGMGTSYIDVDFEAWYSDYFVTALIKNLLPTEHETLDYENWIYSEDNPGIRYAPDGGMTRGEVAELLYRSKALVDNGAEEYTNDLLPDRLF